VSIVLHELGHALVARAAGADPEIQLAGLGGVTRYQPTGRSGTRGWRLAISLAGPGVGLAIGGLAWLLRDAVGGGYPGVALQILLFTSIGWSVFNLLPILPLDGGQALQQLLPGDERTRTTRTAWTGVVTSALLAAGAVWLDQLFIAVFGGLFAMQNYRIATAARTAEREHAALQALLRERDFRGLRDALANGRGDHAIATAAQVGAAEHGELQLAAEIGEVVLQRGTDDPRFAARTAAAWRELGMDERADAVTEGGPPPPPLDAT
jgi:Zn-dependent protease